MKPKLRRVLGHDHRVHMMTLERKAGAGVGNFRSVTHKMPATALLYVRARAKRTAYEARQREHILCDPFRAIRDNVLGCN